MDNKGWFKNASISFTTDINEAVSWLLYGLGSDIEIQNVAGEIIFSGFVNKVDISLDTMTISLTVDGYVIFLDYEYENAASGTFTLREKIIQVLENEPNTIFSTDYSLVESNTLSVFREESKKKGGQVISDLIDMGGDANNNRRIYGVKDARRFFVEEIPATVAYHLPTPTSISVGPLTNIGNRVSTIYKDPDLEIDLPTAEANDTTSQEQYGIFIKVLNGGEASLINAEAIRDTYLNENKFPETSQSFSGTINITDINGNAIQPWDVKPGEWLEFTSLPAGLDIRQNLRDDIRFMFIESVNYNAPYSISLTGIKVGTLEQRLAKLGLGSV